MTDPLRGPLLKVERAKKHIAEFSDEVTRFADRNPYRIVVEPGFNPGNPRMVALTLRIREEIPDHFATIVGDTIHNLRSALDQLTCCVVPDGANDPKVQFPFTASANTFDQTVKERHIDRADPRIIDAFRSMKPYPGGNDALEGIRVLDNRDKHRLLIPVVAASGVKKAIFRAGPHPNASVINLTDLKIFGVKDGQKLIVLPKPSNLKLGDEMDATIMVTFGDGPFANVEVAGSLGQIADYVAPLIEAFRGFYLDGTLKH